MRLRHPLRLSLVCLGGIGFACMAQAQQPAPQPPQLQVLEEGEAPAVTIRQPESGASRIQEKRGRGGRVEEIRVVTGKSAYYLKPNNGAGSAVPGDAQSNLNRGAQWEVLTFDLGGAREEKEQDVQPAAEAPAPPAGR